uniref:Olfactory receptor n=2 Tax=Castor canadensis TaxID=51338 RepID=A0A8B7WK16_CASCN
MEKENATCVTKFVLTGLTQQPEWKMPLFLVFLVIYLFTIVGNLGLIAVIWNDPHLHIPMYLFLGSLAFVDACLSSTVTPKMLVTLLAKNKVISLSECLVQFFSFGISATTECFLLAAMSYDRYVAICKPLLYPVIMNNRLCTCLIVLTFIGGFLHAIIHQYFLVRLNFCNSKIYHFYCDILPLLKNSCTYPSISFLLVYFLAGSVQAFSFVTILASYTFVIFAIIKKKSVKDLKKAFSTCGAHLFSVSLYFGTLLFMYVRPASAQRDDQDIMDSLVYTVIIPVLNPIIYSLRNRQVTNSLKKNLKG